MSERAEPHPEPVARRARRAFLAWIDDGGDRGRSFLQVRIRRTGEDAYEVRHRADAALDVALLERHTAASAALDVARSDSGGHHRPLRSAPDLRRGWVLDLSAAGLWPAIGWLYPAAAVRWYEYRTGTLTVESFDAVAARQTGIYAAVGTLRDEALHSVVRECCGPGSCLRTPLWTSRTPVPVHRLLPLAPAGEPRVPCAAPCSMLLERAAGTLRDAARRADVALDTFQAQA
ncbi:MAG: DR2241 family protein [Gemmatimonadota bacterium]